MQNLLHRLKNLSENQEYNTVYYSIHRSIKNLKITNSSADDDILSSDLSIEEKTYLTEDVNEQNLEMFKKFKSPMRYYFLQLYYESIGDDDEAVEYNVKSWNEGKILNPECFLSSFRSNPNSSFIESENDLVKIDHPKAYKKLARAYYSRGNYEKCIIYMKKAVLKQKEEFGPPISYSLTYVPNSGLNIFMRLLIEKMEVEDKMELLDRETEVLRRKVDILSHHPPQEIVCPRCSENIEVLYSSDVEEIKNHFESFSKKL